MRKCPKCGSSEIETVEEELGFVKCRKCGFDELKEDLNESGERKSQREKEKYNPYKAGGGKGGKRK